MCFTYLVIPRLLELEWCTNSWPKNEAKLVQIIAVFQSAHQPFDNNPALTEGRHTTRNVDRSTCESAALLAAVKVAKP